MSTLVRQRFSGAAAGYAGYADIQSVIARQLAERIAGGKGASILDVGAGDGVIARLCADKDIDVVSLDSAWGMVREGKASCRSGSWVQADAGALPFIRGSFEGVVSSSAYQWIEALSSAFRETRRVLKPGGYFKAALFGRGTLEEFFTSLELAGRGLKKVVPVFRRLPEMRDVRAALDDAGFTQVKVSREMRVAEFRDVKAILAWLKGIGANALAEKFFWGKALLGQTEKEYRQAFSDGDKLRATFEVIWIEAEV